MRKSAQMNIRVDIIVKAVMGGHAGVFSMKANEHLNASKGVEECWAPRSSMAHVQLGTQKVDAHVELVATKLFLLHHEALKWATNDYTRLSEEQLRAYVADEGLETSHLHDKPYFLSHVNGGEMKLVAETA